MLNCVGLKRSMPKRLEWSNRGLRDLELITDYYAKVVSTNVARQAREFIQEAAKNIASRPVLHREGKRGTRECILRKFPYTIIYRASSGAVKIVRVLHQAREYFNR